MTTDDIFELLEGPANVGRRIGVTTEHAAAMKRRGSIPARYWPALVGFERDGRAITYAALAAIAAMPRQPVTEQVPA